MVSVIQLKATTIKDADIAVKTEHCGDEHFPKVMTDLSCQIELVLGLGSTCEATFSLFVGLNAHADIGPIGFVARS